MGRFGKYEVEQVIGRGGMGVVLRALDPELNRLVAIKVIAPQFAASGSMRRRFKREAKAVGAICHDHVVTIHEVDTSGPLPYLVMQYVPGPSLQERLDRSGPLELREILRIGAQAASGLAAAHAHGLIHRDVKPANILLEDDMERVKLTDFGLARTMDDVRITQSAVLAGTPQYMAPEQARGELLDARADLFSLGCVLYAMCVGRPPFRAAAPLAVMKQVCEEKPRSIREQNPNIPKWLEAIVMKLLEKDPAARFQSAAEVSDLLGRCLAHVQQPKLVRLPIIPHSRATSPRRSSWRRPLAMAATFLALLVCGLGATVITVKTNQGTLVIEVDDPAVKVTVEGDNIIVADPDGAEIRLRPGDYKVKATRDGKIVDNKPITIKRGEKTIVTIRAEQPATAANATVGRDVRVWNPNTGKALVLEAKQPTHATFSADGKLIAVGAADGTVNILDSADGKVLSKIQAHRTRIRALKFLPDRNLLITVSDDGEIQVWDVRSGKAVGSLELRSTLGFTALSPDGKLLAGAAWQGPIRLWDVGTGKELAVFKGDPAVQSITFSPDGKLLATGTPPGTVRVWDAATGQAIIRMEPARADRNTPGAFEALHWVTESDQSIAFSPDGKKIACGTGERLISLWDVATGKEIRSLAHSGGQVGTVIFSPDGKELISAGADKALRIWDVATGKEVHQLQPGDGSIIGVAISPDGKRVLTISGDGAIKLWPPGNRKLKIGDDGSIRIWDTDTGKKAKPRKQSSISDADRKKLEELEQIRTDPDARRIQEENEIENARARLRATIARQLYANQIHLAQQAWEQSKLKDAQDSLNKCPADDRGWEWHYLKRVAAGEKSELQATTDAALNGIAFSPDNRMIALAGADGNVRIVYSSSPGKGMEIEASAYNLHGVAFSPDGKLLATASTDNTARLWDSKTGKPVFEPLKPGSEVLGIAFSSDGKLLATGGADGHVRLWDVATGKPRLTNWGHMGVGSIEGLAYSPDGKNLALAGFSHKVAVQDAAAGTRRASMFEGHKAPISAVGFSPDGKRLVSASLDKSVRVWDMETGKERAVLQGHGAPVHAIAFSPDGKRLATASSDSTVKLWDVATGQELLTLKGHTGKVTGVAFSPDGTKLATCGADQKIIIYDGAPTGSEATPGKQSSKDGDEALQEQARVKLQEERDRVAAIEHDRYAERMRQARVLLEQRRAEETAARLDEIDPKMRGWEWQYLRRLAAGEKPELQVTKEAVLNGLGFSPDARMIALAGADGTARLVYASSPGKGIEIEASAFNLHAVAFSPDRKLVATASTDNTARLWDAKTGKAVSKPLNHPDAVRAVAFSPDRKHLVTACATGLLTSWEISTGTGVRFGTHQGTAFGVCFSPDGERIASVGADRTVRIWDAATGKELISHSSSPPVAFVAVAFTPDGKNLAFAGGRTVEILNVPNEIPTVNPKRIIQSFPGHTDTVHAIAFSPDGKRLATASGDGTVNLWDTASGNELLTLKGHTGKVTGVAFSPDGTKLATCGADKKIIIYDGTPKEK
jgi:WD40 repeat protein